MATDFLANLLDRALERAPVLQRRRPSLFEPTPDTMGLGAMLWGKSRGYGEEEPASEVESVGIHDTPALPPTAPTPRRAAAARPAMPMPESTGLDSIRSEETIHPVAPSGNEARREFRQEAAPPPPEQAMPLSMSVSLPPRAVETIVEKEVEKPGPANRSAQLSGERNVVETIVEKVVEKPGSAIHSAHPSEERTETPAVVAPPSPPLVQPVVVPTIKRDQTSETKAPHDASQQREADAALARPAQPVEQATPLSVRVAPLSRMVETIVEKTVEKPGLASRFTHPPEGRNPVETIVERKVEKPVPAVRSVQPLEEKTEKPAVVAPPSPHPVRPIVVPTIKRDPTSETRVPRDASQQREADVAAARPAQLATPPVLLPLPRPPLPVVRSQSVIVREAPPPAPTIQVTIGRIEVRATHSSSVTPNKAASKPAAMSLEDYLRSRSGAAK